MCRFSKLLLFSFFSCKDGSDRLMKRASYSCCNFFALCLLLLTWSIAGIVCRACHSSGTFFMWHTHTYYLSSFSETHTHTRTHTRTHTHTHTHARTHVRALLHQGFKCDLLCRKLKQFYRSHFSTVSCYPKSVTQYLCDGIDCQVLWSHCDGSHTLWLVGAMVAFTDLDFSLLLFSKVVFLIFFLVFLQL